MRTLKDSQTKLCWKLSEIEFLKRRSWLKKKKKEKEKEGATKSSAWILYWPATYVSKRVFSDTGHGTTFQ